jgi:hypothetical protein
MAWMFAATEQDMTIGLHMHYHFVPPLMPPTPFYPHPAIGLIKDKLCTSVKADNRKAAKTGAKTKVLLPPHLPLLGPLTTGMAKENTGVQTAWMGAGIGVHPFGGIGFVVLEGKPAAGMLSNCMGCWGVAPGLDMMLPFVGLDFIMIPTRGPTVFYGPAPLALDLFVFLLAMLQNLFDWILSKVPDGFWKDVLSDAMESVMEGAEVFCDAIEHGASPMDALKSAGKATAYAFVDKTVKRATDAVWDKTVGKILPKGDTWTGMALDYAVEKTTGVKGVKKLKEKAGEAVSDKVVGFLDDKLTGGVLKDGKEASEAKDKHFGKAEAPSPLGPMEGVIESTAVGLNKNAKKQSDSYFENKKAEESAKNDAAAAKKKINEAKTPEEKDAAKKEYNEAKAKQNEAGTKKHEAAKGLEQDNKYLGDDLATGIAKGAVAEEVKGGATEALGIDEKSAEGRLLGKVIDKKVDDAADEHGFTSKNAKAAEKKADKDAVQAKKDANVKKQQDKQKAAQDDPKPNDPRPQEKPLDVQQQKKQADAGLAARDEKDKAAGDMINEGGPAAQKDLVEIGAIG